MASPETKKFIRESRKKLRNQSREALRTQQQDGTNQSISSSSAGTCSHSYDPEMIPIEIYESPKKRVCVKTPDAFQKMKRAASTEYVTLICQNQHEIFIPEDVAMRSG